MTSKGQGSPKNPLIFLFVKIVALYLLVGGAGALTGTRLVILINGGMPMAGGAAGGALLLISAALAVPGLLLLRFSGGSAAGLEQQGQAEDAPEPL